MTEATARCPASPFAFPTAPFLFLARLRPRPRLILSTRPRALVAAWKDADPGTAAEAWDCGSEFGIE
jgi:hypothetical protein